MLMLFSAALAGSPPTEPELSRVCNHLVKELNEPARGDTLVVVLETEPGCDIDALVGECAELGVLVQAEARGLVQVEARYDELASLAALPGVVHIREPLLASPKEEVTEGLEVIFTEDWHALGVDGSGVNVAILDVGFSGWEELVGTELPDDVVDHGVTGSSDHGTAVSEIVHDLAPGATLHLWQFSTDVEYFEALDEILAEDIDVVNASVGFDNVWHADGTSPFAQAVDQVTDRGIVYVAAAGNETGRYRIGLLSDVDGDGWAEIGGEDSVKVTNAFAGSRVSLRWSEPFGEAEVDLDLVLFDDDGDVCDISEEVQDGNDNPTESADCVVNGPWLHAWIRVDSLPDGVALEELTAWVYAPYGVVSPTEASTLTLPADAAGAIAVGAYDPSTLELLEYSSLGPTDDGRLKPDVVAPSGVSTSAYSIPFEGTSAAAPHVTGVVALILDRRRQASPEEVLELLWEQAEDLGQAGPDNAFGHGAVHTVELPRRCGCSSAGLGGMGLFLLIAPLWLVRRRC